jgi:hypothetical protein
LGTVAAMDKSPTKLDYYDDMWKLQSTATLVSHFKVVIVIVVITLFYLVFFLYTLFLIFEKGDDGRNVLILDRTIFYPQGGGQPADTGFIHFTDFNVKFVVHDVRSKDGIVCLLS